MTPEVFIRKVCHDLRAPLRGMKEIPVWLEEDLKSHLQPIPEPVLELLQMLKTQAAQLDVIVIGLSELAKLVRSEKNPKTAIQSVAAMADWPKELECHFEVETLPLEKEHTTLVIRHLVDNAFKHAQAAEHSAELSITQKSDGFHIAVRDFGPGIDSQYFSKIFDPLYSLKSRDDCEAGGMGLAVVEKIATLYDGECTVFPNHDGVGLTFEMVVPSVS